MLAPDSSRKGPRADVWGSLLWTFPFGLLAAAVIVLWPGHLWSIDRFGPEVMGASGVVRFAISFMVIALTVMAVSEAVGRRVLAEFRSRLALQSPRRQREPRATAAATGPR